MIRETFELLTRRDVARIGVLVAALLGVGLWGAWKFLEEATPRRIVLASGAASGMYHQFAERYRQVLARDGVVVEERLTAGAAENLELLLDPKSRVDVAFSMGGVGQPGSSPLEMLATLYYEPLWVFMRDGVQADQLNDLLFKRIAVGPEGSGTRAFTDALLGANGLTRFNTDQQPLGNLEALRAMQRGEIDVALIVGPVQAPAIWQALHDPSIQLMSIARAEAYVRRFSYVVRMTLPAGAVELGQNIPAQDVTLIGTKAMLVARDGLPTALINLLLDAAREIHGGQGYFEAADEFPGTARVDIEVSADAQRHKQFGPNLLHRYMPFWVATFVERLIILVVPLLVILVPLMNFLPQLLRTRLRSRIHRGYGKLKMLERDIASHQGTPPIDQWLRDLDRIERAAQEIKTPASFASEAYTLREHIALVRRAILAKAGSTT